MSEKRFTYFKVPLGFGKQAIKDNANDEVFDFTLSNVLDKLNEQQDTIKNLYDEIHSLKKIIKEQTLRIYCQDQEIQKLTRQLQKIPPNIRDVWLE